jgi:hypothetical protein
MTRTVFSGVLVSESALKSLSPNFFFCVFVQAEPVESIFDRQLLVLHWSRRGTPEVSQATSRNIAGL